MNQSDNLSIAERLLNAAIGHVPFDGWGNETFRAACKDAEIDESIARLHCPNGALDLAILSHTQGDQAMLKRLGATDLSGLKFREKIATAIRVRLEVLDDKEIVRRATTLFALPHNMKRGADLIWGTSDLIWTTLGDTSDDYNWYSKRTILSAVYSATVLYWLGDTSEDHEQTWDFLDRRIENVMQFEKAKSRLRENTALTRLLAGPAALLSRVRAPQNSQNDRPGFWTPNSKDI